MKTETHKNILNKDGPRKDPCGDSEYISLQELHVLIILTLCLLFLTQECKSFEDGHWY